MAVACPLILRRYFGIPHTECNTRQGQPLTAPSSPAPYHIQPHSLKGRPLISHLNIFTEKGSSFILPIKAVALKEGLQLLSQASPYLLPHKGGGQLISGGVPLLQVTAAAQGLLSRTYVGAAGTGFLQLSSFPSQKSTRGESIPLPFLLYSLVSQ